MNIVYVKTTNSSNFFWKTTIIYSKVLNLILNVQVPIQSFYFKLLIVQICLHMIEKSLKNIGNTNMCLHIINTRKILNWAQRFEHTHD